MSRKFLGALVAVFVVGIWIPQHSSAGVTVIDRELFAEKRITQTDTAYKYRISVSNVGTSLDNVKVYVSCDNSKTRLVKDVVEVGDVAADSITQSVSTFAFRHDGRFPLDLDCLEYEIGFETPLRIFGVAVTLPQGGIKGTIYHPDSGRPIIDSGRPIIDPFFATADDQGNFVLEMTAITENDFVVLTAEGVGDQAGTVLINQLGTVGALQEAGDDGSIIINPGNFGSDITPVTTAVAILAERINGGPIRTDGELAIALSQIDGQELLIMAAAIKTFMDNPGVPLPAGINDTVEMASDPTTLENYVNFLETNFPDELNQAIAELGDNLGTGFVAADVPAVLYTALVDENPALTDGAVFELNQNGTGTVNASGGRGDTTWLVDASGDIVVDVINPTTTESFPFRDPPGSQVRALTFTDQYKIERIVNGLEGDQVFVLARTVTTFPDNPALPDEVSQQTPSQFTVRYAFPPSSALPFTAANIGDNDFLAYYYHEGNETLGVFDPKVGADLLLFNADGTGVTQRRGLAFDWIIDSNGKLTATFPNGDVSNYVGYGSNNGITEVLAFGESGTTDGGFALASEFIEADGASVLNEARITNRKIRFLSSILGTTGGNIDYIFLPGGIGCRLFDDIPTHPVTWSILQGNILELKRFRYTNLVDPLLQRSWQGIRTVPGTIGDRIWTINTADFRFFFGGQEGYQDPTTNPGRLLAFEDIDDVTGQVDPCNFGTSTSVGTPFNSNNGGTGNMFDVATGADSIEVTTLNVNVDFPQGTFFGIKVFVANSSYEDTITAPPGCIFGCEFDPNLWTEVATGGGFAAGQDFPSNIDVFPNFNLPANATSGIWVSLDPASSFVDQFRYTNGSQVISDGVITITTGAGVTGPTPQGAPATVTPDRSWNGVIFYNRD